MTNSSEAEMNEADEQSWQKVCIGVKRSRQVSPTVHFPKRQIFNNEANNHSNRFAVLDNDDGREESGAIIPKPPPIFIPNVTNITRMISDILKLVSTEEFTYKSLQDGQVRLMIKNIDAYRKIIKQLEKSKISFHSYQIKQERSYRVVIKGLHHSTDVNDIKSQLTALGHKVRNIVNVKSRVTKQPLSIFSVELEPNSNNKQIYDLKHINNAIVTVEPPKKVKEIVQCYRCQMFGHTKTYCNREFKCVKCGLDHLSTECTKDVNSPPQCANCMLNHTSSYKGCKVYQHLLQKKTQNYVRPLKTAAARNVSIPAMERTHIEHSNPFVEDINNAPSYAQVLRGELPQQNQNNSLMIRIEQLLNKQLELTNNLMNMMTLIVTKLCN